MQPFRASPRRIRQPLRAEAPLAYERLSDPILVRRAKDGDRRALGALCARHQPKVEKLARRVLHDREDARDAAQDALAQVCTSIGRFRGEAQFATWLHRLVLNACHDVAARRRLSEPLREDLRAANEPDVETRDALRSSFLRLPPAQARVVVLKDGFGWSFDDIAAAERMPVGTAKCYAHRGRARLREQLEVA